MKIKFNASNWTGEVKELEVVENELRIEGLDHKITFEKVIDKDEFETEEFYRFYIDGEKAFNAYDMGGEWVTLGAAVQREDDDVFVAAAQTLLNVL